jgi:hypothetical protein
VSCSTWSRAPRRGVLVNADALLVLAQSDVGLPALRFAALFQAIVVDTRFKYTGVAAYHSLGA